MGIFDFLRGSSKEKKTVKKIKLEEAGKLINSFREKVIKEAALSLKEIKQKINYEKKNTEDNIKTLEEAEFNNKAFPEQVIPMMRDNRRTYIQKIKVLLKEIELADQVDEIPERCINLEHVLNNFGKSTIRNHQILQQYFGEKVSSIAKNLVSMHKLIEEAKKLANDPRIIGANELKSDFKNIQEQIKFEETINDKISLETKEGRKINKNLAEIENKIKNSEEGRRYEHLMTITEKRKDLEKDIRDIEKEPLHSFSVINDALKKYERMSLDNRLIKKYLENPLKTLEEDKELKIVEIVSKMKDAVSGDKIELKKERKDKTTNECSKMTRDYLESFLERLSELNKKLNEVNSEIINETIMKEIEDLKEELRKEKTKVYDIKHKIEKMTEELGKIEINRLKKELESSINRKMVENVKIVS